MSSFFFFLFSLRFVGDTFKWIVSDGSIFNTLSPVKGGFYNDVFPSNFRD
jgi:hypothetical protein